MEINFKQAGGSYNLFDNIRKESLEVPVVLTVNGVLLVVENSLADIDAENQKKMIDAAKGDCKVTESEELIFVLAKDLKEMKTFVSDCAKAFAEGIE